MQTVFVNPRVLRGQTVDMFSPQLPFDAGPPAMHLLPCAHAPPLTPIDDSSALDDLVRLFGEDTDPLPVDNVPPERVTNPGIDDANIAWPTSKPCHLPQPSPFESMPDPLVLQELSAEATATCGNLRGLSHPAELQPSRHSDLASSTGRKVTKGKRGGASKVAKGFRRLSSEVRIMLTRVPRPSANTRIVHSQGSHVAGRTAMKLLWTNKSGTLVPAATAPVGKFTVSPQPNLHMQHGNLASENAQLRQCLDAALTEVELLRDVVGRLLELRGPTRVPSGAARMVGGNHAAPHHQQAYQNMVYQHQ